ncbi:CatB-related O-acetyltransferase [Halodesulfovibrio marinisediminis]|uniref:Chloramphenicol acetyltransferase n=1 Tax=Halodesulfovibrio marinisediminis DSM 17456 TaxID=1121457 RepID=A0A1N6E8F8_9BACT|nr:CatB-related O-acetyltransferase [Halodesulfovibrio marinisediminis]SIN79314.1 chloramphenicol O-acetyltransferase type B [Halodesulfovibrio marinisediminis DSM 17456]
MTNPFSSPYEGYEIRQHLTNKNIIVGRHSYYSGYYHGKHFEENVRYLSPDRDDVDKLIIGKFCSIGSGVVFMMAGNQGHRNDWLSTYPFHYMADFSEAPDGYLPKGDTIVGNDVWIGSEAMIMPGITIGHGAIIAARSVVTKNVPEYTIVGGNPAKLIRERFSADKKEKLLQMAWWDWSDETIRKNLPLLCSENLTYFVNQP